MTQRRVHVPPVRTQFITFREHYKLALLWNGKKPLGKVLRAWASSVSKPIQRLHQSWFIRVGSVKLTYRKKDFLKMAIFESPEFFPSFWECWPNSECEREKGEWQILDGHGQVRFGRTIGCSTINPVVFSLFSTTCTLKMSYNKRGSNQVT